MDVCRPRHEKYNLAVSTVFGKHMDDIVVRDNAAALRCMDFLRNNKLKATAIPLADVRFKPTDDRLRSLTSPPGQTAQLLLDVLEYDEAVYAAVQHTCKNAVVCDTVEQCKSLCFEGGRMNSGDRVSISCAVALDGTFVRSEGRISGGFLPDSGRSWESKDVEGQKEERRELRKEVSDTVGATATAEE